VKCKVKFQFMGVKVDFSLAVNSSYKNVDFSLAN